MSFSTLTRRVPLRSRSSLTRTPLAKVSAKRRKLEPARKACLAVVRERSGNRCEFKDEFGVRCAGPMDDGHEPLGRAGGAVITDPQHVKASCRFHNGFAEDEPELCYRLGWKISRYEGRRL